MISPKRPNPSKKIKKTPKIVQIQVKVMFRWANLSQFQLSLPNKKPPRGKMTKMTQVKRVRQEKNRNRPKGKRPKRKKRNCKRRNRVKTQKGRKSRNRGKKYRRLLWAKRAVWLLGISKNKPKHWPKQTGRVHCPNHYSNQETWYKSHE